MWPIQLAARAGRESSGSTGSVQATTTVGSTSAAQANPVSTTCQRQPETVTGRGRPGGDQEGSQDDLDDPVGPAVGTVAQDLLALVQLAGVKPEHADSGLVEQEPESELQPPLGLVRRPPGQPG
jgi:hypothetical protein